MKVNCKTLLTTVLAFLMVVLAFSCKKNTVKKVVVDSQFAIALYSDTVSFKEILNDMDSTSQMWLRIRNDSIFAFYVDTIREVLKASDLLGNIQDVSFNTCTNFTMPSFDPTNNHDTVVEVDRFMTVPFYYEGYNIEEVVLRGGMMSFDLTVNPQIEHLRELEVFSNHLISPEGEPLSIVIDYTKGRQSVDLAGYSVVPEDDTVAFSARVTLHVDSGVYEGGQYQCNLMGGLTDVKFKTVFGTIDTPLDSLFNNETDIEYGIKGLSGSAILHVPTVNLDYVNTFGFGAIGDVTTLKFINTNTGEDKSLIASDMVEVSVNPTDGEWRHARITGWDDNITVDALAGYTKLEFGGELMMSLNTSNEFSISDTSTVDIAADIEMPIQFKLTDLQYTDTIPVDFSDASQTTDQVDNYVDEIEFFVDYNSKIKIDVDVQVLFLKNNTVIERLFDNVESLQYSSGGDISTISVKVTGRKLKNVLRANQMVLSLGASTEAISSDPVQMLDTDAIFLRMRMHTKTSEFDFDDNN